MKAVAWCQPSGLTDGVIVARLVAFECECCGEWFAADGESVEEWLFSVLGGLVADRDDIDLHLFCAMHSVDECELVAFGADDRRSFDA